MARLFGRFSKKLGMAPGSVVYVGRHRDDAVRIEVMDFTENELTEHTIDSAEQCHPFKDRDSVTWINVTGVHDVSIIERLGAQFGLHPLIQEDIANTSQRAKFDQDANSLFMALKMLYTDESGELHAEQVSLVVGSNWVLTFQEDRRDVFEHVRERIRKTVPRVRFMTTDYVAYSLIDAVVDHYFVILERIGERMEELEDDLVTSPGPVSLAAIQNTRKELVFIRKAIWPLREVVGAFERTESSHLNAATRPYLRDLYEHVVQVIDTVETFRDMVGGLLDIYLSSVSNRMNEVMKVLTIIATIFIPLGFLAGVYGMNFDTHSSPFNLPELGLRYGYMFFWGVVGLIALGMVWYFRRKKWL